jgi:hypothetical protein
MAFPGMSLVPPGAFRHIPKRNMLVIGKDALNYPNNPGPLHKMMLHKNNTPLNHFPVLRTTKLNELKKFYESSLHASITALPRRKSKIDLEINRYQLPNRSLWFSAYGMPISLKFFEGNLFRLQFQQSGTAAVKVRGKGLEITPDQSILSPYVVEMDLGEGFKQKALTVTKSALMQKIAALTGTPAIRDIEFDPVIKHTSPNFSILKQTFDFIAQRVNSPRTAIPDLLLAEFDQTLVTAVLGCCHNNYTELLERRPASAS